MWLFSGGTDDPEIDTVMEQHGADALYSAVKCLMQAIQAEDKDVQHDVAHRMIQIAKPSKIKRWSESKSCQGIITSADTEEECTAH